MAKIRILKPAPGSFNKLRPVSHLLKSQVKHLLESEKVLPHDQRSGVQLAQIKTEAQAAEYIRKVTAKLHSRHKIKVLQPSSASFRKDRPLSALLRNQIQHLHEVEKTLPLEKRTATDVAAIRTEAEAAAYIKKITAVLHPEGASTE
jgi:hypothetical protein